MCQAIPRRVLRLDAHRAEVDYDGVPTWVEASSVPDLEVGQYVVVYAGQALERMNNEEAEEMLGWYANLEALLEEADARA